MRFEGAAGPCLVRELDGRRHSEGAAEVQRKQIRFLAGLLRRLPVGSYPERGVTGEWLGPDCSYRRRWSQIESSLHLDCRYESRCAVGALAAVEAASEGRC